MLFHRVISALTSTREGTDETNGEQKQPVAPDVEEVDSCSLYDYDAENMNDPNAVSMYAVDIFKYHFSREVFTGRQYNFDEA
ncbi:unnamed protein product [Toxocara canis]|uniref:Uncharacterized protein n=1 Tax=Toxocara canis TaxID=6265 RepID=A0A183U4H8_TOXCA|nr:unnamed protein product [Toxocara canis]